MSTAWGLKRQIDRLQNMFPPAVLTMPALQMPALEPMFRARWRGSKFPRLCVIVCPNKEQHTLIEVFPTEAGPVAVWRKRLASVERVTADDGREVITRRHSNQGEEWAAVVPEGTLKGRKLTHPVGVACRCRELPPVTWPKIQAAVKSGDRRVVLG